MADEDKNKKRSIWDIILGDTLSTGQVLQLRHPDDAEVRALERKNLIRAQSKEDKGKYLTSLKRGCPSPGNSQGISKYIYEPYVRYKRTENPDYKRHRNYSLAGILTGAGLLVTGLASGNLPFAYVGAALAIASFGYHSGHWYRKERTDMRFEKASFGLESLFEKRLFKEPDKGDKDDTLYIRRTHKAEVERSGAPWHRFDRVSYHPLNEPTVSSGVGYAGIALTSVLAFLGLTFHNKGISGVVPMLYATGASALATLSHYVGFIFGYKRAKPEYKNISGLDKKVEEKD